MFVIEISGHGGTNGNEVVEMTFATQAKARKALRDHGWRYWPGNGGYVPREADAYDFRFATIKEKPDD